MTPGGVVVGLDETGEPKPALEAAFEEAARRQATLSVRHAWRLAPPYNEPALRGEIEADWRSQTGLVLDHAVEPWGSKHPTVRCDVELLYDRPVDALAEEAEHANLLILGRRTRRGPLRIGSVARAMIRISTCPVMVIPVADLPGRDTDDVAHSEELSPQT